MPDTVNEWLYVSTFALWLATSLVLMCIKKYRLTGKLLFWMWLIVVGGIVLLSFAIGYGIMHYCSSVGGC